MIEAVKVDAETQQRRNEATRTAIRRLAAAAISAYGLTCTVDEYLAESARRAEERRRLMGGAD